MADESSANRYRGSVNRSVALSRPGWSLTVGDVLLLELPHIAEAEREGIAWEFTGFPCFWSLRANEWNGAQAFRRQLREFRTGVVRDTRNDTGDESDRGGCPEIVQ